MTALSNETAAVLLNMSCDATIQSRFDEWENSPEIQGIFNTMVRFKCTDVNTFPIKKAIVRQIQTIYTQNPITVYYFIYGIPHKEQTLIDYNREEINEELFVINDQYIAPNIIIIDINHSFSRYRYEFPKDSMCNIYRAALPSEFDLSNVLQKFRSHNKPITIDFLINECNIAMVPLTPTTSSFITGPISSDTQTFFMTHTTTDFTTFQQKTVIYQILSQDDFRTCEVHTTPYPALNVLSIYFRSPYYYVFTNQQGNFFEVFEKSTRKKVYFQSISSQPAQTDLNKLSIEYTFPNVTAMAFALPNKKLGLFRVQKNRPFFSELNCMNHHIESMTFGIVDLDESLIYIHNNALRMRKLQDNYSTTINNDLDIVRSPHLSNMFGAKLIWREPNAVILSKRRGLFWNGKDKVFTSLYEYGEIDVHHVDTFWSRNDELFGFVWSASEKQEKKNVLYVHIGIENYHKNKIRMFDITPYIQAHMSSPQPCQSVTPALFLKDKSARCTKLYGALIYRSRSQQTIVKHIDICLRDSCFAKDPVTVKATEKFPGTNIEYNIKVMDPTGKKLIVYFSLENNTVKGQQLFSFSKEQTKN